MRRHSRNNRCEICGGYEADERGAGKRCYGFTSPDGQYVNCTRSEHAGLLELNESSKAYVHRLVGDCNCGVRHDPTPARKIVATYDYTDEMGTLLYQVVRYEPKSFTQRRPEPDGNWTYKLGDVKRVLYNLPELKRYPNNPVYIVEGEKDADTLTKHGFLATTNAGGAEKWRDDYSEVLRERDVIIVPDNDEVGLRHRDKIAQSLQGVAKSVQSLVLENSKDVSEWFAQPDANAVKFVELASKKATTVESAPVATTSGSSDEKLLLGTVITTPDILPHLRVELKVWHLLDQTYQKIYKAMLSIDERGEVVDIPTLFNELQSNPVLGASAITREHVVALTVDLPVLAEHTVTQALQRVRETAHLSYMAKLNAEVSRRIESGQHSARDIYEFQNNSLDKLSVVTGVSQDFVSFGQMQSQMTKLINDLHEGKVVAVSTGFRELDNILSWGGLLPQTTTILAAHTSFGKAQPLDAPVLTPHGFVAMGSLRVGDYVVGSNGLPTKVVGVFPQGEKDIYRVSFSDGATVDCCDEHLWKTSTRNDRQSKRQCAVRSLKEIRDNFYDCYGKPDHRIPLLSAPVQFVQTSTLPLHPYLLGALLGDGGLSGSGVKFTNTDSQVLSWVAEKLPSGDVLVPESNHAPGINYRIQRGKRNNQKSETALALTELDLMNKKTAQKFIPVSYLVSTPADRLELLRGLFDTDGHVVGNRIELITVSRKLARDITFLVGSLGGFVRTVKKDTGYKKDGVFHVGQTGYRLSVYLPEGMVPVACAAKASKYKRVQHKKSHRTITGIEQMGKTKMQCIAVDAPDHLYVAQDFVLTHNTALALELAKRIAKQGFEVAFFSLEMSKESLFMRVHSNISGLESHKIRPGMSNIERDILLRTMQEMASLPIYVNDRITDIIQMRGAVRTFMRTHKNVGAIIVDYLQLANISSLRGDAQERERISEISRLMKQIASEFGVAIIELSQFSRESYKDEREPVITDLYGSGSIEKDADNLWFLHGERPDEIITIRKLQFIFAKQRMGRIGRFGMDFDTARNRFISYDLNNPVAQAQAAARAAPVAQGEAHAATAPVDENGSQLF